MIEHAATKIGLIGLGWQGFMIAQHLADCDAVQETDPVNLANAGSFFDQKNVLIMASGTGTG